MEQRIGFCDVGRRRIAYASVGDGPALVFPGWFIGHLEATWENARFRAFMEALATHHTVVRYDPFGTGLSDRDRTEGEYSLDVDVEILAGVVDHLELHRFSLFAFSCGAPVGVAYAADQPERVSRLILYGGYADGARITGEETRRSLTHVVDEHWNLGSRVVASLFLPATEQQESLDFSRVQRAAADAETAARLLRLTYELDATPLAPEVHAPTLVLHRRGDRTIPYALGRELAAAIPGAQFVSLDGSLHFPWIGDTRQLLDAVAEFVRLGEYPLEGEQEAPGEDSLSDREREVLVLVAEGLGDKEIAERLVLSPHTVHRHVANIRTKLGAASRTAAVAEGYRLQLI